MNSVTNKTGRDKRKHLRSIAKHSTHIRANIPRPARHEQVLSQSKANSKSGTSLLHGVFLHIWPVSFHTEHIGLVVAIDDYRDAQGNNHDR